MKKIHFVFALLAILLLTETNAQSKNDYRSLNKLPSFYFGLGGGLNYNCGLAGIKLGVKLTDKLLLDVSAGLGSWGNKVGLGIIFNAVNENAWCPILSISRATGLDNVPLNLEFIGQNGIPTKQNVNVTCNPATLLNLGIQRQWIRPTGNRITLEMGYSVLVDGGNYQLLSTNNKLSDLGVKTMNLIAPGGLTFGFAYYFGIK